MWGECLTFPGVPELDPPRIRSVEKPLRRPNSFAASSPQAVFHSLRWRAASFLWPAGPLGFGFLCRTCFSLSAGFGRLFPMLSRISRVFAARPVTGTKPEKHFPQRFCPCWADAAARLARLDKLKACPTKTACLALEQNGQSRVGPQGHTRLFALAAATDTGGRVRTFWQTHLA